jgi:hypothetical protein
MNDNDYKDWRVFKVDSTLHVGIIELRLAMKDR